ncbi:MAG: sigma-70 family RNA polymerase sigma factor [Acidobacteria bacterium]|nr:sigma-70 family RNA polymerase sigma factor [Acidobacteriota bacterium]
MSRNSSGITERLRQAQTGGRDALQQVIPCLYLELKKIAAYHLRRESAAWRLGTTALVHEAYLRLASADRRYENRVHFCGIASRVMRQVLVDQSRARNAAKRGAGCEIQVAELADLGRQREGLFARLDDALHELSLSDPRKTELLELRYFGGLTLEESAEYLGISVATVRRELRLAQAWLRRELAS